MFRSQRAILDLAELTQLRQLFENGPNEAASKRDLKLTVGLVKRTVFTEQDLWRIVFFRYGSFDNFDHIRMTPLQISKYTNFNYFTIYRFLQRFEKHGHTIIMARKCNGPYIGSGVKIDNEIGTYLVSQACQQQWCGYTLKRRV